MCASRTVLARESFRAVPLPRDLLHGCGANASRVRYAMAGIGTVLSVCVSKRHFLTICIIVRSLLKKCFFMKRLFL